MRRISIGLLGLGNVGAGVVRLLRDNAASTTERLGGAELTIRRIAVRDADRTRLVDVDPTQLTLDAHGVATDPEVDIVVEVMGGLEPARTLVLAAIAAKKHVVTANKALLSEHGEELFAAAAAAGVDIYYEASVAGGVPVVRALREGLASDRVDQIVAIVNGTSNFLLTAMADEGRAFADVLADAQRLGYAEADPSLDVDGWDAAHKLSVLLPLCFGTRVPVTQMLVQGLRALDPIDFRYAARFGYVITPLAIARDPGDSIAARVHPALIPRRFLLASVHGVFNAVYVSSQALGPSLYYGRGAGMMPTAVAVVSDLYEVSRNLLGQAVSPGRARGAPPRRIRAPGEVQTRYYLRFSVRDQPGVLGRLCGLLGEHEISIREVVQEGPGKDQEAAVVPVVRTTHQSTEANMQAALARIDQLAEVVAPTRLVRIFD